MEVVKKYLHKNAHLTKAGGILILALFVFGVLVPTGFAHAGFWDWAMDSALDSLGGFVFSIFAAAISLFVSLAILLAGIAGSFLQWILHFGLFYTKCAPTAQLAAGQCFIDVAWGMARDFVNIALIIGLVVIAFFTIIGNQAYSAGKALFPFIAVAILVNFSRVVVGVVVDLSNIVMGVFVQAMPNLSTIDAGLNPVFSFEAETGLILLVTSVLDLLFWMGLAFILALYGIIFAVRYGMIWMLTIMSPIAFAAWIFPSTKKIFNMWRDQLVQWSFIGIPVLFFLWIALKFCEQIRAMNLPEVAAASSGAPGTLYAIFPSIMCLLLLVIAFMFGIKTGAMGSGMIISQTKKLTKAAGGAARGWAAKSAAQSRYGLQAQRGLEKLAGGTMARIPIVGGGVQRATQFGSQKIRAAERSKEAQEAATRMSDGMLTAQLKTENSSMKYKALFDEKLKRGDGKDIDELKKDGKFSEKMSAHVKNLSLRNQERSILDSSPEYAYASSNTKGPDKFSPKVNTSYKVALNMGVDKEQAQRAAMAKQYSEDMTKKRAESISDSSLANPNVIAGLQDNKAIDILSDMATSTKRQENILAGFTAKNNGNRDAAFKELAQEIKQGNVRNAGFLLAEQGFREAFATLPHQMTRGIIMGFSNIAKNAADGTSDMSDMKDLFTKIHNDKKGHDEGFNKIYADTQVKAIIEVVAPDLVRTHDAEGGSGGGAAGGGGGLIVPPPGASGEALRRLGRGT